MQKVRNRLRKFCCSSRSYRISIYSGPSHWKSPYCKWYVFKQDIQTEPLYLHSNSVDKTDGFQLYLSLESLEADIVTAKVSEV